MPVDHFLLGFRSSTSAAKLRVFQKLEPRRRANNHFGKTVKGRHSHGNHFPSWNSETVRQQHKADTNL
jgi:hypothetical protein